MPRNAPARLDTGRTGVSRSAGWLRRVLGVARGVAVRIQVLGPVRAWRDGAELVLGSAGQRAILGLLAVVDGRAMSRDELVDALWGERPPSTAINVIQTHVKHLRQLLEPVRERRGRSLILPSVGTGYALRPGPDEVDLARFRRIVGAAEAVGRGDRGRAAALLGQALRLWQDAPLADLPSLAAHPRVVALAGERRAALVRYADAVVAAGTAAAAIPLLAEAAASHPLDEALQAGLIRAHQAAGQRAVAVTVYHAARRRLATDLGVDPGPELRAAYDALLHDPADTGPAGPDHHPVGPVDAAAAGPPARPVPAQLPADVSGFTGRAAELDALTRLLPAIAPSTGPPDAPTTLVISAVSGTAGVGKTALALHWAHRIRDRFPDGQLYLNLRGFDPAGPAVEPAVAVRAFLDAFAVAPDRIPSTVDGQIALYRSLLDGKRILIVLDNARDAGQIRPLLPGSTTALVIVTSRSQLTPLAATNGAQVLTLDLLSGAEARELLAGRLGRDRLAAEPRATEEIIARCVGLPLALTVAAARAATRPAFPLTSLAAELAESSGPLDALTAGDPATDSRAVFSWSYATLIPAAARLFRLLGLHPGPDISVAAAASLAGVAPAEARRLLAELARASLIAEHVPGRYACHDLLRAYAADLTRADDPAQARDAAFGRLLDHYLHTAHAGAVLLEPTLDAIGLTAARPGVTPERLADYEHAIAWFGAEYLVLLAVLRQVAAAAADAHGWQLAWALLTFLDRRGHWPELAFTQQVALSAAERLGDQAEQARAHRGLARAYGRQGRHDEALVHLTRANDLYQVLGNRVGQTRTELNLTVLFGQASNWTEAVLHAERALALARSTGEPTSQAMALNSVGWCYAQLGDYPQALTFCEQALALHRQLDDRRQQASVWDSLGYVHQHLGDYGQATVCYGNALSLLRELADRNGMAETLTHLGDAQRTRAPDAARSSWQQALGILTDLGHPAADTVRARLRDLERTTASAD
jgi:DNA-binding SARP family transcriptional activator/tetratricopeptide (TPR) repeat protein